MKYRETIQSEKLYHKVGAKYGRIFQRAILAEGRLTKLVQSSFNRRSVLDIACGNGRWLERFTPASYVGLDINFTLLGQARLHHPAQTFVQGDMTDLPFPGESFEGVMSLFGAMGHLPPQGQERMLREAHRVLKKRGVALFTNGNMWSPFNLPSTLKANHVRVEGVYLKVHSATPNTFRKAVVEAGFELLEMSSYDYSYVPLAPIKLGACLFTRITRVATPNLWKSLRTVVISRIWDGWANNLSPCVGSLRAKSLLGNITRTLLLRTPEPVSNRDKLIFR